MMSFCCSGHVDNVELLTYQLHTLREKCEKLEHLEKEYYQLQTDNKVIYINISMTS